MENQMIGVWLKSIDATVKACTYLRYKEIVRGHILPFLSGRSICELKTSDWEEFIFGLSKSGNKKTGKGLSDNSIAQIIGVTKRLYRYMIKEGYVLANPVDKLSVRIRQRNIDILNEYEQKKIERDIIKRHSLREYGVIIALYTGLRIGELLALEWADVDIRQRKILVQKTLSPIKISKEDNPYIGTTKTDCGTRVIPFPKSLVPLFMELKKKKSKYVVSSRFGRFVMVSSYQKSFGKLLERLGLRRRGFHSLRHTFATRAIERGADMKTLSEILGHSSPTVTMARYVHSTEKQKYKLMEKVGSAFKIAE